MRRICRKRRRVGGPIRAKGEEEAAPTPLYTILDALNCLDRFGRATEYQQSLDIALGIRATCVDAGHVLGSASILIEVKEGDRVRSVLFSGDIGNSGRRLLRPPAPPVKADFVVMESTYGDRLHRPFSESIEEFYTAICGAFARAAT